MEEAATILFERLRAAAGLAALNDDELFKVCAAIMQTETKSFEGLLDVVKSEDDMDDLNYNIRGAVGKNASVIFKNWLKEEAEKAMKNPNAAHFYDMGDTLNDSDASDLESNAVLRVDIDPSEGSDELPEFKIRVPYGAVDRQVQASSNDSVPIISMIGPTGTGKSFLGNSFLSHSVPKSRRPMVARPDQNVPTSANVNMHRGHVHPDRIPESGRSVVLLDFEGEDGRTPKTLVDLSREKIARFARNFHSDAIEKHFETAEARRNKIIKRVLPPLAYLISDVIVFIDTVEPRRTERVQRIREFSELAHECVGSMPWRPALIIVQNKWIRSAGSRKKFDVTDDYDWICSDLKFVFPKVTVVRIPPLSDLHWFEDGMCALHDAVESSIRFVQSKRAERGQMCSEREFWFNFDSMVTQFCRQGLSRQLEDQNTITAKNRISRQPTDNVLKLMELIYSRLPDTNATFRQGVNAALNLYAYAFAGEARCKDTQIEIRQSLAAKYEAIVRSCLGAEPCTACLRHGDWKYKCKQRRGGHEDGMHRNPAMVRMPTENTFLRVFSFGLWKDKVPCVWPGNFETTNTSERFMTRAEFEARFEELMRLDDRTYEVSLRAHRTFPWSRLQDESFCALCLRGEVTLVHLQKCKHPLCVDCVLKRKSLSDEEDKVICPFCHTPSFLPPTRPDPNGLRILTLDGGGVRGLIEVMTLKKLEHKFAPLGIKELFDVVVGTSAGGIITLALLAGHSLERMEQLFETMASDILDVTWLTRFWRFLSNDSICDSHGLDEAFQELFGEDQYTGQLQATEPPYMLCTSYIPVVEDTALMGSFPVGFGGSTNFRMTNCRMWEAAKATSAAPPFFSPWWNPRFGSGNNRRRFVEFVDGGILANCPAKLAVRFAKEYQACNQMGNGSPIEMIASIGTGKAEPSIPEEKGNGFTWGKRLINIALHSDRLWRDDILRDESLADVPKIRINPPNLGSLDAFKSSSIPGIRTGMEEYFTSAEGTSMMNRLYHLTFAKLWQIHFTVNPIVGEETTFHVSLRDRVCNFSLMQEYELRSIISDRSEGNATAGPSDDIAFDDLRKLALERFCEQPLVNPLPGHFVYAFDGQERQPLDADRSFSILFEERNAGLRKLEVFWRSEDFGDFKISGVPRFVEVLVGESEQQENDSES